MPEFLARSHKVSTCPAAVAVSEKFVSLEGKRSDWGLFCSRSSTSLISRPEKERENGLVPTGCAWT